jgi:hypothetical protein
MADGYLGKCKDCTKVDVKSNRKMNIDYYREYDRNRGNRQTKEYKLEYRFKFPGAYKAKTMVNNAIRDKKLFKEPCEICGYEPSHAHHDDYLKPLNIRWLCPVHHSQWHKEHGMALNPF